MTISFSGFVICVCVCFVSSVREGHGLVLSLSKVRERGRDRKGLPAVCV